MLGDKLKMLRGNRTQKEVAEAVGVSKQAISTYENNQRAPSDKVKKRLAEFFGVSIEHLFFDD